MGRVSGDVRRPGRGQGAPVEMVPPLGRDPAAFAPSTATSETHFRCLPMGRDGQRRLMPRSMAERPVERQCTPGLRGMLGRQDTAKDPFPQGRPLPPAAWGGEAPQRDSRSGPSCGWRGRRPSLGAAPHRRVCFGRSITAWAVSTASTWRSAARGRVRRRSAARGRVRSMLWAVDRGVGRVGGQHAPRSNQGVGISLGSCPRLLGS